MDIKDRALFSARDVNNVMDGKPLPVLTTLMFAYCDNDPAKFERLCSLIDIVQQQTIDIYAREHNLLD